MDARELEELKLDIVLAGFEIPEQRETSDIEIYEELFRKIYEERLRKTAEKARSMLTEIRAPNVHNLKSIFIERLERIADEAQSRRLEHYDISSELNHELKAISNLFRKARRLIETIPADCSAHEFKRAVSATLKIESDEDEWLIGDWGESIHCRIIGILKRELYQFLEKI